jgi:exopolysaccharide production protein ExoQ
MPAGLATIICALGILGIFLLDRDRKFRASPVLWIPVAWLSIGASRTIAEWLGGGVAFESPDQYLDGSPLDQLVLTGLLAAGLMVLLARRQRAGTFLRANGPLLIFFLYCAVSVLWSDYPFVAFKRWTKALGNLVMVLIVLTDPDPLAAVKRLLARTGFLLIPLSVLLIKYYPELGRGFSPWTGEAVNSGVATGKNGLGWVCLVFGLGSLWRFLDALHNGERPRVAGPLVAHGTVLATALWLFWMADSAASLGCFLVGGALMVLTRRRGFALGPTAVHILAAGIVSLCLFGLFVNRDVGLVQAFGRDATLTGRTELWEDLLRIPVNPLLGSGFESFWLGERAQWLWEKHPWHPNQAHNGYLEVYLNSGWLGVALLGFVMAWGYRNVVGGLHRDTEFGRLRLAFFMAAVLQNLTEATFKVMHPVWIAFLLAVTVVPPLASPSGRRAAGPDLRGRAAQPAGAPPVVPSASTAQSRVLRQTTI